MKRESWEPPRGLRALAAALWLSAGLTALYWLVFFTTGQVQSSQDPVYLGFERAFPVADAWMALTAAACAEGLRRRRPWAVLYGVAAGSAFVYLGCMDALYNLENGMYAHMSAEMMLELSINVSCFIFGPLIMWYVWHQRRWLGA